MEFNNQACLPSMKLSELNGLLQNELRKETRQIDADLVRQIMQELETRPANPALVDDAAVQAACDRYRAGCTKTYPPRKRNRVLQVLTVAAVICLLVMVVPIVRGENNLLEFVCNIRNDVVAFFNPAQADNRLAYEYQTDHPGLKQLHDAVTGIGVTEEVVPARISDELVLTDLEIQVFPSKTRVWACFESEYETLQFYYDLYGMLATYEYAKDETPYDTYERAGVVHEIYFNHEKYTVLWEHDNLKCSIVTDCQEDQLIEILKSIYIMEDA